MSEQQVEQCVQVGISTTAVKHMTHNFSSEDVNDEIIKFCQDIPAFPFSAIHHSSQG